MLLATFSSAQIGHRFANIAARMANVAIVLDEPNILISLRMAFEAEGFAVDTYAAPLPALPKLILVPPSVLILNGHMPGMHGIEFFLKFRTFCSTPVIFLSASADEIEVHLQEIGKPAGAYIRMPFSQREIIAAVRNVLASRLQANISQCACVDQG